MTAPTLSLTESQTLTAVRAFVLAAIGDDGTTIEVVRGQDNRVAPPSTDNYVVMTPMHRALLETPTTTYHDGALDPIPGQSARMDKAPATVDVQLNFHGDGSHDLCTLVQSLVRTTFATEAFEASGFDVTPLYAGEPHQSAFVNAEQQVENTWVFDLSVQCNPIVTSDQDFATGLEIGLISVDAAYPA